ncbi:hypothetical protein ZIOFF_069136 [Zingiber officinale]|uniref:Uncharacterized protein n=1 Tax=Zingiber officinale TaxID=94328 RepID=A0A8J5C3Q3_ZINOF|nr:hypothetical protein ZIOFF_069136 [Zingiber officinale]
MSAGVEVGSSSQAGASTEGGSSVVSPPAKLVKEVAHCTSPPVERGESIPEIEASTGSTVPRIPPSLSLFEELSRQAGPLKLFNTDDYAKSLHNLDVIVVSRAALMHPFLSYRQNIYTSITRYWYWNDQIRANRLLGIVAQRGTSTFLKALKENKDLGSDNGLIGQFGVRFYSAFLVAERPDDKFEFMDPSRIQGLVKNYSQFVSFPWQEKSGAVEVEKEEEPKEGEEAKPEVGFLLYDSIAFMGNLVSHFLLTGRVRIMRKRLVSKTFNMIQELSESEDKKRADRDIHYRGWGYNLLCDWMKQQLGDKVAKVQVSKRLCSSPCVLVSGKFGWSANMEGCVQEQPRQHGSKD